MEMTSGSAEKEFSLDSPSRRQDNINDDVMALLMEDLHSDPLNRTIHPFTLLIHSQFLSICFEVLI